MARRRVYTMTDSELNPTPEIGFDERVTSVEPFHGFGVTPELRERLRENAERNELAARREYLRRKAMKHLG